MVVLNIECITIVVERTRFVAVTTISPVRLSVCWLARMIVDSCSQRVFDSWSHN